MPKKIKLNLQDLNVESFTTAKKISGGAKDSGTPFACDNATHMNDHCSFMDCMTGFADDVCNTNHDICRF